MLTPFRLYIAATNTRALESLFFQDADFHVLSCSELGNTALNELLSLESDVLLLDSALTGMDSLALLDILRQKLIAPPRVLFLSRSFGNVWEKIALEKGADMSIAFPCEDEQLLFQAKCCARIPIPALAKPMEETRFSIAAELLDQLGVPRRLKGWRYMHAAAAFSACAPQFFHSYTQSLYPFLAARFQTTSQAVERAIRTAVENTWLHGNLSAIQNLFGFSVDADRGKPTNAEFLSMLAEHTRRKAGKERFKRES